MQEIGVVPDFAFGLTLADGSRRNFLIEIDRGTMPVVRSDILRQTSFEEKMRAYLTAHAANQHERQFGWKTFRVLTVTTDDRRARTMMEALRRLHVSAQPPALRCSILQRVMDCAPAMHSRTSGMTATGGRFS